MELHSHASELSIGLCLFLGAIHALEPGHGKSAFVAHLLAEKKSYFRPLALAFTTAVTHAISILLISFVVHQAIHATIDSANSHGIYQWLNLASGLFLFILGFSILAKARVSKPQYSITRASTSLSVHSSSCSCALHRPPKSANEQHTWRTVAIGFAVGLVPCPSALAALSTALASKDFATVSLITAMFSLGIFISLTVAGSFLAKFAHSLQHISKWRSRPNAGIYIQSSVLVLTGAWRVGLFFN